MVHKRLQRSKEAAAERKKNKELNRVKQEVLSGAMPSIIAESEAMSNLTVEKS